MRQSKVDRFIAEYCRSKRITFLVDSKLDKDNGLCYPQFREVHLAERYSSQRIKLAIFLHEVGHIRVDRKRKKPFNAFECELLSWQLAIQEHKRIFGKFFSQSQTQFMLKCLTSYSKSRHEFRRDPAGLRAPAGAV